MYAVCDYMCPCIYIYVRIYTTNLQTPTFCADFCPHLHEFQFPVSPSCHCELQLPDQRPRGRARLRFRPGNIKSYKVLAPFQL